MGSFNAGCGISNLAIKEGDEVGYVLLAHGMEETARRMNHKTSTSLYSYANRVFQPVLPPIFGKYDNYGGIEDIQESPTTRAIEELFKLPVEEVLNFIARGRQKEHEVGDLFHISGMFFLKEVYDEMKRFAVKEAEENAIRFEEWGLNNWDKVRQVGIQKFIDEIGSVEYPGHVLDYPEERENIHRISRLKEKDYGVLRHYVGNNDFHDLTILDDTMNKVNRMFMPSFNGEDEGSSEPFELVAKLTTEILERRRKEFEDDDEDETEV